MDCWSQGGWIAGRKVGWIASLEDGMDCWAWIDLSLSKWKWIIATCVVKYTFFSLV